MPEKSQSGSDMVRHANTQGESSNLSSGSDKKYTLSVGSKEELDFTLGSDNIPPALVDNIISDYSKIYDLYRGEENLLRSLIEKALASQKTRFLDNSASCCVNLRNDLRMCNSVEERLIAVDNFEEELKSLVSGSEGERC